MNKIFGITHTIIVGLVALTGIDFYDRLMYAAIAILGYIYAFRFTGGYANELNYNPTIMSFVHWFIRTVVVVTIMLGTRFFYSILVNFGMSNLFSAFACIIVLVIFAEVLKRKTRLRKSYF